MDTQQSEKQKSAASKKRWKTLAGYAFLALAAYYIAKAFFGFGKSPGAPLAIAFGVTVLVFIVKMIKKRIQAKKNQQV
jgi:Flp pilus assembly protein TadB